METIFHQIAKISSEGGSAALATVVQVKGSTPRAAGSKILIKEDGAVLGSIGGGALEAKICREAMSVLKHGKATMLHFDLKGDAVEGDEMLCGGEMDVFIEPLLPQPTLYIFGAGHISRFISKIAKMIGFMVVVIDDRAEFANAERFPEADEIFAEDFPQAFSKVTVNDSSYIVIVTRNHQFDEKVLEWAVQTDARYIGMIGSKKKNEVILAHLSTKGVPKKRLEEIHAPIGLDINAETPEEIALSIMAEIIKVRRARSHTPKTWKV
jgi:xanthine dehydrogenase accessory factor